MEKDYKKKRVRFAIKYGILGWGVPTGVIVTVWSYFDKKPQDFTSFILDSIPTLIVFPLLGIVWGLVVFNNIKKQ